MVKGLQAANDLKIQLQQLSGELETAKRHEQEAKMRKNSAERELQIIEGSIARAKEEFTSFTAEQGELQSESEHFDASKEELTRLIEVKESELHVIELQLAGFTEDLRHSKQGKDTVIQQISDLKSRLSAGYQEENGKVALKERLIRQTAEIDNSANDFNLKQEQLEAGADQNQRPSKGLGRADYC